MRLIFNRIIRMFRALVMHKFNNAISLNNTINYPFLM